jgi:hypothetical protein
MTAIFENPFGGDVYVSVRIRMRIDCPHPLVCRTIRGDRMGAVLRLRPENRRPMSQKVWHDKDPPLLKGPEQILQPFIGNGDVSTQVKISLAGRKTVRKSTTSPCVS